MTKIDPSPLIAEAQARETALHVACDRIMRAETELRWWRAIGGIHAAGWIIVAIAQVLQ